MNIKHITLAVSLAVGAASAMAAEAEQWNPLTGHAKRGEVKAELSRAAANGELEERGQTYGTFDARHLARSSRTRAEVKEELAQARANGELEQRGQTYGSFTQPHPHATARAFAWHKRQVAE